MHLSHAAELPLISLECIESTKSPSCVAKRIVTAGCLFCLSGANAGRSALTDPLPQP